MSLAMAAPTSQELDDPRLIVMSKRHEIDSFFLILVDDKNRRFAVVGPIEDDTSWTNRVCKAQEQGHQVRCFTTPPGQAREQLVSDIQHDLKLTYTEEIFV